MLDRQSLDRRRRPNTVAAQGKRIIALLLVITRATSAHIRRWGDDLVELRRESRNQPFWGAGSPTAGPRFDLKVEKRSDARRDCSVVAAELVAHNTGVIGTVPRVYSDNQAPARHGPRDLRRGGCTCCLLCCERICERNAAQVCERAAVGVCGSHADSNVDERCHCWVTFPSGRRIVAVVSRSHSAVVGGCHSPAVSEFAVSARRASARP